MSEASAPASTSTASSASTAAPAAPSTATATSGSTPIQASATATKSALVAAAEAAISGKGVSGVKETLKASQQTTQPAPSPAAEPAPESPQAQATAAEPDLGLSPQQIQALKRAQVYDPEMLALMPVNNRKAMADRWASKLAENDRNYQKNKNNKPDAQPGDTQDGTDKSNDAGTPQDQQEGQPSQATTVAEPFNPKAVAQTVLKALEPDAQETQTLVDQFGEDGVAAIRQRESRLVSSMADVLTQQVTPLLQGVQQLAQILWNNEFEQGVAELRKQPGYESIEASEENLSALRRAIAEHARSRNGQYRVRDAVKAVAGEVFKVDPHLAAQAQLARSAAPMLSTSGARPSSAAPTPKPLTERDRIAAAARAALENKGAAAVRQAYAGTPV